MRLRPVIVCVPLAVASALVLAGCGNKGDLYLPDEGVDAAGADELERALRTAPGIDVPTDAVVDPAALPDDDPERNEPEAIRRRASDPERGPDSDPAQASDPATGALPEMLR